MLKLKCISVYVTDEQYEFLKSLRSQKVSMSGFIRGLLHLHMYAAKGKIVEVVERKAVTVVSRRKMRIEDGRRQLYREVVRELKEVLKGRRVD